MSNDVPLRDAAQALLDMISTSQMASNFLSTEIDALRAALAAADTTLPVLLPGEPVPDHAYRPPVDSHGFTDAEHDTLITLIDRNAKRVGQLLTLRSVADGTTPTQPDEVLWEGETRPLPRATRYSVLPAERISVPPRTRVRVVATPATEQT